MKQEELIFRNESLKSTGKMPVLFLGHGSPMNAIEENEFVQGFRKTAQSIEKPTTVLCISAHWETRETCITAMEYPRTIHDFGGFPIELFEVNYPAMGNPVLALEIKDQVQTTVIGMNQNWGFDHGTWSVLKHMYPEADVPVIQLSLDYTKPPAWHYELGKELSELRERGVLIVGSGNMVHNLRRIAWDQLNADEYGYDWAIEASAKMKEFILDRNHKPLINYSSQGKVFQLAIPTPEHYLPLLYTLALSKNKEKIEIFNDKTVAGSLTMTSVKIG